MEDNNQNQHKESPAGELEQAKKEKEEYLNGWKRAKADLINYQKEEGQRFEEVVKFGNLTLIGELIQVLDSFDLALSVLEKDGKADKGIYMIKSQLEDVLKKRGVEAMKTSAGDKFDPSLHEAVSEVESKEEDGTVVEEVEKGYILNGRVIRPSKVKISKQVTSNKKQEKTNNE